MRKIVCDVCGIPDDVDQLQIKVIHGCCRDRVTYYLDLCRAHIKPFWVYLNTIKIMDTIPKKEE